MSARELEAVRDEVDAALRGSGWTRVRADEGATWFGPFVSAIALAVGSRALEHLDSIVRFDEEGLFSANVIVFTDKTVVFADAAGASGPRDDVKSLVIARPRSGLTQLTIVGGTPAFGRGAEQWPGDFTVTAKWDNGAKVTFPLSPLEHDDQRRRFMALYSELSAALGD
jgi:hypothetical protein